MDNNLIIVKDRHFAGFVGQETKAVVNGTPVCVGDVVHIEKGESHNDCTGVVALFGNTIGVMGLASTPVSKFKIAGIVQSHKDLEYGHSIVGGFAVDRLRE